MPDLARMNRKSARRPCGQAKRSVNQREPLTTPGTRTAGSRPALGITRRHRTANVVRVNFGKMGTGYWNEEGVNLEKGYRNGRQLTIPQIPGSGKQHVATHDAESRIIRSSLATFLQSLTHTTAG